MVLLAEAALCCCGHQQPVLLFRLPALREPLSLAVVHNGQRWARRSFPKLPHRLCVTERAYCRAKSWPLHAVSDSRGAERESRGLLEVGAMIGAATAASKVLGMGRETVLAAVFGTGPVITAFNYSSIVPSIFLSLLGGINGPFHLAVTAALSKRPGKEGKVLVERASTVLLVVCTAASVCIYIFADRIIDTMAPGFLAPQSINGLLSRDIAIVQLKVMAPSALLSALIGVGFGTLSSAGIYGITSLIPALSSVVILGAVATHILSHQQMASASVNAMAGGIFIATGSIVGAALQWLLLAKEQQKAGFSFFRVCMVNPYRDERLQEVFAVLLPAAFGSGVLQIATFTDLYFASFLPGAAAALGYANLLAMAPIGILSNSILLPFLPIYSRLSQPSQWQELRKRVQQGLLLAMALTLPMTAVVIPLAQPIVRLVFQRYAFDASACVQVSSLLAVYVSGSTFYLARDLLVRVFYALGDGQTPFYISVGAIFANGALDWLLTQRAGFGAKGLVMATVTVNMASAAALLLILGRRLGGLSLWKWMRSFLFLASSAAAATAVTKLAYSYSNLLLTTFTSTLFSGVILTRFLWGADVVCLLIASICGILSFSLPVVLSKFPEVDSVVELLQMKLHK